MNTILDGLLPVLHCGSCTSVIANCGHGHDHRVELVILAQELCLDFTALLKYDKIMMNFCPSCTIPPTETLHLGDLLD